METSEPRPDAEKCPDCGGWINETSPGEGTCSSCGKTFAAAADPGQGLEPPPAVIVCPQCGSREEVDADTLYCDQCGASLAEAAAAADATQAVRDDRPTDGVCPDCGGPVVEVSPDEGVCKKCGEKLITPGARSRRRWGLAIVLVGAAIYIFVSVLLRPHRGY